MIFFNETLSEIFFKTLNEQVFVKYQGMVPNVLINYTKPLPSIRANF
jgi:hypothetical protein